ncbi:hypothetical protein LTR22_010315 [Elasticomyces elasticus]|nr:hypothetical protein LTR22_010315 [Elasticomyces elasticus]
MHPVELDISPTLALTVKTQVGWLVRRMAYPRNRVEWIAPYTRVVPLTTFLWYVGHMRSFVRYACEINFRYAWDGGLDLGYYNFPAFNRHANLCLDALRFTRFYQSLGHSVDWQDHALLSNLKQYPWLWHGLRAKILVRYALEDVTDDLLDLPKLILDLYDVLWELQRDFSLDHPESQESGAVYSQVRAELALVKSETLYPTFVEHDLRGTELMVRLADKVTARLVDI